MAKIVGRNTSPIKAKRVARSAPSAKDKLLKSGLTKDDVKVIEDTFPGKFEAEHAISLFASILMPIKLSGLTTQNIKDGLPYMGKSLTDKNVWRAVNDLNSVIDNYELAVLALKAGLSLEDARKIKESGELTKDSLETMIMIKKL